MTSPTRDRRRTLRLAVCGLVVALAAGACTSDSDEAPPSSSSATAVGATTQAGAAPGGSPGSGSGSNTPSAGSKDRLVGVRLSPGAATPAEPVEVAQGDPLEADRIAEILGRLPAWDPAEDLSEPFRWPSKTLTPPAGGTTVDKPFPPATGGPSAPTEPTEPSGPLTVLRSQPEGDVKIAPFVSITFSHSMVPVGTVGQIDQLKVPATITPEVPGHWEWIGTSTLRFVGDNDAFDRLPMATKYTVTVPSGTASVSGAKLAKDVTISFSTPAPSLQELTPSGNGVVLQPVFLAVFDQQIDVDAVLAKTSVKAGDTKVAIRRATAAEIAADKAATERIAKIPAGRWLAFRPEKAMSADTPFVVSFAAGTPSAEGPVKTAAAINKAGRTYKPLTVISIDCTLTRCEPGTPLRMTFSNPLDRKAFDPEKVTVEPALPGQTVQVIENEVHVSGNTVAGTTYSVTVPGDVTDIHGQTLGEAATKEIKIGPGRPRLQPFPHPLTTLDPMVDSKSLAIHTQFRTEFRLRVFAVTPELWREYDRFNSQGLSGGRPWSDPRVPDWTVLTDKVVAVDGDYADTVIDLSDELAHDAVKGHLVVLVEPTRKDGISNNDWWQNAPTATWVQATTLGLDAWTDPRSLLVWATDLRTGAPVGDLKITPIGKAEPAVTDAEGRASIPLSGAKVSGVLAERDGDVAILPASQWWDGWRSAPVGGSLRWYVNDDRQTYRPGETVSVKGWVRSFDGDVRITPLPEGASVTYTVRDGMGNQLGKGAEKVGKLGGFDFTVKLKAGAALGQAYVELQLAGGPSTENSWHGHAFTIADFRTPDFEVAVGAAAAGPHLSDAPFTVDAEATYYAGGALGAAPVDWQVRTAPGAYSPPGWDTFTFGRWTPWWLWDNVGFGGGFDRGFGSEPFGPVDGSDAVVEEFSGETDVLGAHHLQVEVGKLGEEYDGLPVTVTAQAKVTDVNRQALAGTTDILVHPADFYVGLAGDQTFVPQGEPLTVSAIVTDIDGRAAVGREVKVRAAQLTSSWVNGVFEETEVETGAQECVVTSGTAPVTCTFQPSVGGSVRITATVADDAGRHSRSELTRWVGGATPSKVRYVQQEAVTLIPDRADYAPGDTAKVLVQSPLATGTGLLTISRVGITSTKTFDITGGSAVLDIPVAETDVPTVNLSVEVVGTSPRTGADGRAQTDAAARPAFATGELRLAVSAASRELDVTVVPRDPTVKPGGSTTVDVTVRDKAGKPLPGSEFELVVVDEAVLALGGVAPVDPLEVFYAAVESRVSPTYGRSGIALGQQPPPAAAEGRAEQSAAAASTAPAGSAKEASDVVPTAAGASMSDSASQLSTERAAAIAERTNFEPLAVFEPSVTTDAAGKASVAVTLPDSLTRYRVLVVAVAGADKFGMAEANLTAGLPLMVRPTAPRFLNFGDAFALPVVVQNNDDAERTVEVVLQTANLTAGKDTDRAGQLVRVPAGDRVEVRFDVAASKVGTGKVRVAVVSGDDADAATVELPVYTPATAESFAGYGTLEGDTTVRQPILAPKDVIKQVGGLQVSTSSTALATLTDAVLYLTDYQYESSDGLASQVLAIATLGEVLAAFKAPGLPSPQRLKATAQDKIDKLVALQNKDGGFPYWQLGRDSEPFNSVLVTQALAVAMAQGFSVPKDALGRATEYLKGIRSHLPAEMPEPDKDTIEAYALNVRMEAGDRDNAAANKLFAAKSGTLGLDALAWLWPVVDDPAAVEAIDAKVRAAAVDTAGAVSFTDSIADGDWTLLQSDRRNDALLLDALVRLRPTSDLIPKAVAGLLAAQVRGRWETAQDNTFALVALKRYFDAFEAQPADFVSKVWLGDRFAAEHTFQGHSDEIADLNIPTADLLATGDTAVTLNNDGTGRMYYRIGMQTAPADLDLEPLDRGFVLSRSYEGVDDPADVTRDADGTWRVKAGAVVRVKLALVARSQRTGVAMIDPIPAGLEILNPALATTPKDLDGGGKAEKPAPVQHSWLATWFDHQNLRDDRAEAYASYLPAGDYDYSYLARATTPGSFVVPPTRAEEMYAPETFGRAGSDRVVIEG